jgi:hypothetical protein
MSNNEVRVARYDGQVNTMKKQYKAALAAVALGLILLVSAWAAAYSDLDNALNAIARGFETGDSAALAAGIDSSDKIELQFPGLVEGSGFFGPDQAALVLDDLFKRTSPSGFEQTSARKVSAQKQYHITGSWTIAPDGKRETREVYIILQDKGDSWSIISIRAAGK